jgi:hypothetical protein
LLQPYGPTGSQRASLERTERPSANGSLRSVYPFLRACEDLQSRLYSILERDGLTPLRERDPEEPRYAEEILYPISRYFGWERYLSPSSPGSATRLAGIRTGGGGPGGRAGILQSLD